jgi:hypothetical protein
VPELAGGQAIALFLFVSRPAGGQLLDWRCQCTTIRNQNAQFLAPHRVAVYQLVVGVDANMAGFFVYD